MRNSSSPKSTIAACLPEALGFLAGPCSWAFAAAALEAFRGGSSALDGGAAIGAFGAFGAFPRLGAGTATASLEAGGAALGRGGDALGAGAGDGGDALGAGDGVDALGTG